MAERTQIVQAIPAMASQLFRRLACFGHRFDRKGNQPDECPDYWSKIVFRTVPCCHQARDSWRWKYALAWLRVHVLRRILGWPPPRGGAHLAPARAAFCCA